MENWEEDPLYMALEDCCVDGGADRRALSHYIKNLIRSEKEKMIESIDKFVQEMLYNIDCSNNEYKKYLEDWNNLKNLLKK